MVDQLALSDYEEDARVCLNSVMHTVSVSHKTKLQMTAFLQTNQNAEFY